MSQLHLKLLEKGKAWHIYYVENINNNFDDFLKKQDKTTQLKIIAYIEKMANNEKLYTKDHCKKLRNDIYELKVSKVRILFCYSPDKRRIIIIFFGFIKKCQKTPKKELKRAEATLKRLKNQRKLFVVK